MSMSPTKSEIRMFKYLSLIGLRFKVLWRNTIEWFRVIWRYYFNAQFRRVDLALLSKYIFDNPFAVSKRFLLARGESDLYTFGETPLTTLDAIATQCELKASDCVFELGCGRARTCFWLREFVGCSVVGIDFVPAFIERANRVKQRYHISQIEFRIGDILEADLTGATVIYLYGTCYSDTFIEQLIDKFRQLPDGSKIITVSYALTDYGENLPFVVTQVFSQTFTWGDAEVYLHLKK